MFDLKDHQIIYAIKDTLLNATRVVLERYLDLVLDAPHDNSTERVYPIIVSL